MSENQYNTKQTLEPRRSIKKTSAPCNYYNLKYELNIKNMLFTPSIFILSFWRVIHELYKQIKYKSTSVYIMYKNQLVVTGGARRKTGEE